MTELTCPNCGSHNCHTWTEGDGFSCDDCETDHPSLSEKIAALEAKLDEIPSMSVEELLSLIETFDRLSPELKEVAASAKAQADRIVSSTSLLSQRLSSVAHAVHGELKARPLTFADCLQFLIPSTLLDEQP